MQPRPYRAIRVVSAALASMLAAAVLLVGTPASASVSKHHGKWMGQVSGCKSNFRIGKTARLVNDKGADFGWVEWRASRTRSCAGYQWVRLHLNRDFGYQKNESDYKGWSIYYKSDPWGTGIYSTHKYNKKAKGLRYLKKGSYNSRIFYAPNAKACALLYTYYSANTTLGVRIKGQGDLPRLKYCA